MSLWIDIKYCNLVGAYLDRFKIKNATPYRANFRCPFCGDSKKSQFKARGFFLEQDDGSVLYKCHNCGIPKSLHNFLKDTNYSLYSEYVLEKYVSEPVVLKEEPKEFAHPEHLKAGSPLLKIKKISQLKHDHPARLYIDDRKIPTDQHAKLFYAPKFAKWVNSIIPKKLSEEKDTPRLILPFIDENGKVFGFQGRSFDPNEELRYITIMLEDRPKVFGLNSYDKNSEHFVVEGPIDSLFLPNCIAMAGADLDKSILNENSILVFDNEPRNKEIVDRMYKANGLGYKVCIWPDWIKQKDINDMILSGLSKKKIVDTIRENSYSGIIGLLKLNEWKKI